MSDNNHLAEMLKDMMPELYEEEKASAIDANKELETLKGEIAGLKGTLENVAKALDKTVVLYKDAVSTIEQMKAETLIKNEANIHLTKSIVSQMVNLLEIDYNKFTKGLLQETDLNEETILKRVESAVKDIGQTDDVVQKLADKLRIHAMASLQSLLDDMDMDAEQIAEQVCHDTVASHICYSTLSDYVAFDPTEYWDSSDLAQYFSETDIADYVCTATVAEHISTDDIASEVDLDDVASHISAVDIAQRIDLGGLSECIDLDELAQKVAELRGESE